MSSHLKMSNAQNRTVLVAGASGVIGRRLCSLLRTDGWRVVGITRSEDKAVALRSMGVEPIVVNVFDAKNLSAAVVDAQPSVVVHQLTELPPALEPGKMATARVRNAHIRDIGTRNLVTAALAAGAKRFVAQSVSFAYAPGPTPYREDWPLNAGTLEGASGATARGVVSLERQVLTAALTGVVLRYGRLYGPETGFDVPSSGGPVHVDAAADAARRAVSRGRAGVYNIAEEDGTVSSRKAAAELDWRADFRMPATSG